MCVCVCVSDCVHACTHTTSPLIHVDLLGRSLPPSQVTLSQHLDKLDPVTTPDPRDNIIDSITTPRQNVSYVYVDPVTTPDPCDNTIVCIRHMFMYVPYVYLVIHVYMTVCRPHHHT